MYNTMVGSNPCGQSHMSELGPSIHLIPKTQSTCPPEPEIAPQPEKAPVNVPPDCDPRNYLSKDFNRVLVPSRASQDANDVLTPPHGTPSSTLANDVVASSTPAPTSSKLHDPTCNLEYA